MIDSTTSRDSSTRPRVMILGVDGREDIQRLAHELAELFREHADIVQVDIGFQQSPVGVDADLAVVLGGDGSILRAAHHLGYSQVPVLGVNLGKLGFLADLLPEEVPSIVELVCGGKFRVVEHLMFECEIFREGERLHHMLGLNETTVLAGYPFRILHVDLYVDAELVTTYSCDGLIVATPVGSTAHSLSAGGPILRKNLHAFVISPISPHTLTNRPVVDTADRVYELVVPEPGEGTSVVVDGTVLCQLKANDRVRIVRAEPTFKLVEVPGRGYYRTLREKLGWGGSLPPKS